MLGQVETLPFETDFELDQFRVSIELVYFLLNGLLNTLWILNGLGIPLGVVDGSFEMVGFHFGSDLSALAIGVGETLLEAVDIHSVKNISFFLRMDGDLLCVETDC